MARWTPHPVGRPPGRALNPHTAAGSASPAARQRPAHCRRSRWLLRLCCALLLRVAAGAVSVTIGTTGTDDALLLANKTIVEGTTPCASATHCYVSADALQSTLANHNVSIMVTGAITIAAAPTDGQPLTSAAVTLTLAAGSASSSLDHMLISAPLNLGAQGTLYMINQASGGITCVVGGNGATFGGAPTCTDTGGAGGCLSPGLFCFQAAELQRITAKSVYISNAANAAFMALNGLAATDTAGIADILSLATNVNGFTGSANQQFIVKSATSQASCSLHLSSNMGMTVEVQISTTAGDLLLDGDADGATVGTIILTTPLSLGGVPQSILAAGRKLTIGANTGGVIFSGAGHLKLSANGGVHITSNLAPTVNGLEVHIDADTDATEEGTLKINPGKTVGSATQTRNVYLTAADIDFGTSTASIGKVVTSGSYQIYLYAVNGKRIGLGTDLSSEGGMSVSGNELYGFASKITNIGGSLHGGLVVSGISETQSMNTERWVLTATSTSTGTVSFQDSSSNFRVLDVIAFKGITVNVPGTEGVKTTYFTGTMTMTVQGTAAEGAFGFVFAAGTYLNCATKLTLTSASGATGDSTLYLNAASGIQLDIDLDVTSTSSDIAVMINCDTDLGGVGRFTLCGSSADTLSSTSTLCTAGAERQIRLLPASGYKAAITVKSMELALAGTIDAGSSGSVTMFPSSFVQAAIGDKINVKWTLTQEEYDRLIAGDSLTLGSNELEWLVVSGIRSNRTGATRIVASRSGASVLMHKEYNAVAGTWSPSLQFGGALTLEGGDGVFVNDSLTIGGALVVDANADNAGGDDFYCIDGNKKLSCSSDADCSRNLCSDGVTFCDGGQIDCTGSVCNVPASWGSCVSKGEFRLTHNLTIATGGLSITADAIVIMPQSFPWHSSNETIGGHLIVNDNTGNVVLRPKTVRGVRLGQFPSSQIYWRGYEVRARYGTTFGVDQHMLDSIHMQGSLTVGNDKTSSIQITGLTFTRSSGYVSLISTYSAAGQVAFVNSSECSDLPTGCTATIQGPLYITTLGACLLSVDISVFLMTADCDGATTQTGTLLISGAGVDLRYIAVGDVVISGNVINQDRMIFSATGHVNISSDMTCRGKMTIIADSDKDGHGTFSLSTGNKLTSQSFDIDIHANNIELGGTGTAIRAGVGDISITVSDGGEIGLGASASGLQLSPSELIAMSCRNLTIGGANSHVRIGDLPIESLSGVAGYVVIRASSTGSAAFVGVEGAANLSFPALDLEVAGNISVFKSVFTTERFTLGPIRNGPAIVAGLRLAALGITISSGAQLSSAGDLFIGHYSGSNGASPWGAVGSTRIGDIRLTAPSAMRSDRHLVLLSHVTTSGSGVLELSADQDGDLDGTVQISQRVQVYGSIGTSNGTMLIAGNDVRIPPGSKIHLDRGDLLVTASDFAFGPAPDCNKGASLSLELVNLPQNQDFLTRSATHPGAAFFEPVPTILSKITSHLIVLDRVGKQRGAGRGQFAPRGGDVISIFGSAFGPQGLDAKFSTRVGDRFCALSGGMEERELVPLYGIVHNTSVPGRGSEGERVKVWSVREYNWNLVNGTLIRRFSYSFSVTCAMPPGSGESLDLLFVTGWCGSVHRERSLLGYSPPLIDSIVPSSVSVGGAGGAGSELTFIGSGFGISAPIGVCSSSFRAETCEGGALVNNERFAGYLRETTERTGGGNLQACDNVEWTSDSSISCTVSSIPSMASAKAVVVIHGQEGSGGLLSVTGTAAYIDACDVYVRGFECQSGDCKADCTVCCRRSCQQQWHAEEEARAVGGGLDVSTVGVDPYARCAVLCIDYCKDAPSLPRDA